MANSNLIQGAGIAADRFDNIQGGFNAGAGGIGPSEGALAEMRNTLYKQRQDEVELKNYVNSMDTIEVSKVEPGMRDEVNSFLISNRNKYAKAAKAASTLDADDPAYMKAIATMNSINSDFKSLSTNLDEFKKKREQYYTDTKNNSISESSIVNGNTANLNSLYKNNDFDIIIEPGGTFQISHEGEFVPFSDFEKDTDWNYHLINAQGFDDIMKLTNKAQNGGAKIEGGLETNYKYQLNGMFNTMGREDMMSMVYDTVISDTPMNDRSDWNDDLLDIENDQALRSYLSGVYLEGLKKVASSAYNEKRAIADQKILDAANKSRRIAQAKASVVSNKPFIDQFQGLSDKEKAKFLADLQKSQTLPTK